jgi:hypothetical protein
MSDNKNPQNQNQNKGGEQRSPDLQTAAAVAQATGKSIEPPPAGKYPEVARVRSKVGRMVHLHTNVVIDENEKKIPIDGFARAQLDAGKWEIVTD